MIPGRDGPPPVDEEVGEPVGDAAPAAAPAPAPDVPPLLNPAARAFFRSMSGAPDAAAPADAAADDQASIRAFRQTLARFRLAYKFGIDEMLTKINILREEFQETHDYSPIEHVNSRVKTLDSLYQKLQRAGVPMELDAIRERVRDIAGVRITCAFVSDAYWVARMLTRQEDITVVEVKDYIAAPKTNGYQSLHLIVQVPVFLSDRTERVYVEVQIRTIAMDFWASLEHKIYYKYERDVPAHLLEELREAARTASELDEKMARLRDEIRGLGPLDPGPLDPGGFDPGGGAR